MSAISTKLIAEMHVGLLRAPVGFKPGSRETEDIPAEKRELTHPREYLSVHYHDEPEVINRIAVPR